MCDVVILGAGPAGMSAAWWSQELGLRVLLLEQAAETGGQLLRVYNPIANYLGLHAADGRALREHFAAHLADAQIATRLNVQVAAVDAVSKTVTLPEGGQIKARGLIIATGVRRRRLGIAGESELAGRGVLVSGMRDRTQTVGQKVCVIGGGDAAAENALLVAEYAESVTLLHRGRQLRAREEFTARLAQHPRVRVLLDSVPLRICGPDHVTGVAVRTGHEAESVIAADAVLVRIGVRPNSELLRPQLTADANGYLITDALHETNLNGVFAIGDVANPHAPTIAGATGAGATAAKVLAARLSTL